MKNRLESKLHKLFDANVILSNSKLDHMIADSLSHYSNGRVELSDEEAEDLAAAGQRFFHLSDESLTGKKKPW